MNCQTDSSHVFHTFLREMESINHASSVQIYDVIIHSHEVEAIKCTLQILYLNISLSTFKKKCCNFCSFEPQHFQHHKLDAIWIFLTLPVAQVWIVCVTKLSGSEREQATRYSRLREWNEKSFTFHPSSSPLVKTRLSVRMRWLLAIKEPSKKFQATPHALCKSVFFSLSLHTGLIPQRQAKTLSRNGSVKGVHTLHTFTREPFPISCHQVVFAVTWHVWVVSGFNRKMI